MNFVTLFNMENVHITKDVGMIPYGMHKYFGYDSYCASYENGSYPAVKNECKGMKMWFVKKITGNFDIDAAFFLIKNAKKIDILNVYHIRLFTVLKIFIYKMRNPDGKLYWKMDGGNGAFDRSNILKRYIYKWAMGRRHCIMSTELRGNIDKLENEWGKTFLHIPNPYQPNWDISFEPFEKRKNTILTVGRLGTKVKATEILLDGFKMAVKKWGLKGWSLKLIGGIEPEFEKKIADWYAKNPDMKQFVYFAGKLDDRKRLNHEYREAKVFAFPSRCETYGIATAEAAVCGCFIIASDIPASREITEQFRYAASFPVDDIEKLAEQLAAWCTDETAMEENAKKLYECVKQKNALYKICENIQKEIQNS